MVSGDLKKLNDQQSDVWDSGKVKSNEIAAFYEGKPLESFRRYFWKMRVYDQNDAAGLWSAPASFETAMLNREDWIAEFIGGSEAKMVRKEFSLPARVVSARAYVSAIGLYELSVNGRKIGHNILDPVQTNPTYRLLYSTYDVSDVLVKGRNAVGAMLGGGPYGHLYSPDGKTAPPRWFLMQLNITLADGTSEIITTDVSWKQTAEGPVIYDELYRGETYDARREIQGWCQPYLDDTSWSPAECRPVDLILSAQPFTLKIHEKLAPTNISEPAPGAYVFDFGKNIAGKPELTVDGPAGTTVQMRFAEVLHKNGSINWQTTGREWKAAYTLSGIGKETWSPRFGIVGFRYVELTGFPGRPDKTSLQAHFVTSDISQVGDFECSNPVVNKIHKMYLLSQRGNLSHGIPTDCPHRERLGWLGDVLITSETMCFNFDTATVLGKWFDDLSDDVVVYGYGPNPRLNSLVPWPKTWAQRHDDPPWFSGHILIPWDVYLAYGDAGELKKHYGRMKRVIQLLDAMAKDQIIETNEWADWVSPYGHHNCSPALLSTGYYYRSVDLMSRIAAAIGESDDARRYAQSADRIRDAINAKWYKDGNYDSGSQTANSMALHFDIVREEHADAVLKSLTDNLARCNYHVTTGVLGTHNLMNALWKYGLDETAYAVASRISYPSLGYMVQHGATTPWERWWHAEGGGDSHNHVFLSGPAAAWFYKGIAGISPLKPGFAEVLIRPAVVADLSSAIATIHSVRGTVSTEWQRQKDEFTLSVCIPYNTTGYVFIPTLGIDPNEVVIKESGSTVWNGKVVEPGSRGLSFYKVESSGVVFKAGSGSYSFRMVRADRKIFPAASWKHVVSDNQIVIDAQTFAQQQGTAPGVKGAVGHINEGDWLRYDSVNLSGKRTFEVNIGVDPAFSGKTIQLRLDSPDGPVVSELVVSGTGGWDRFHLQEAPMKSTAGIHDIILTFRGGNGVGDIQSIRFSDSCRQIPPQPRHSQQNSLLRECGLW
jgi:alpha-L-rhamnosidase